MTDQNRRGMIAAIAVVVFAFAYAAVLLAGLASLPAPIAPIGDPWFSVLEILIVAMMPAIVALMAAVRMSAPRRSERLGQWAYNCIIVTAGLTATLHICLLALRRSHAIDEHWSSLMLSFEWPSVPYIVDIIAWDLFFGLGMLIAAPLFGGGRLQSAIRAVMTVSGVLALAGLAGPISGDMRLRSIGILGYAGAFPIAAALLALHFRAGTKTSATGFHPARHLPVLADSG